MFTKINRAINMRWILNYHEHKVQDGQAECLYAGNFLKDTELLSREDKRFHFQRLIDLNDRLKKNMTQIILSFHQSEFVDNNKMRLIGREYMREMALDKQPFLIYRHYDAVNPHAHIILTNIKSDGTSLKLERRHYFHSRNITKKLDQKYKLVPSAFMARVDEWDRQQVIQKVIHGVTPLHSTFNAVLGNIIPQYKYTSLDELNIILRSYNIRASTGEDGSLVHRHRGLIYLALDERSKKNKAYIKASILMGKPTLKNLEKRFVQNEALREPHRQHLTTAIDWAFYKKTLSFEAFEKAMEKESIGIFVQKDAKGDFENIWYTDYEHKTIFNGNDLGEQYTAGDISRRCVTAEIYQEQQQQSEKQALRVRPRLDHM